MELKRKQLRELYEKKSSILQYQSFHSSIQEYVDYKAPKKSRYESERCEYILKNVEIQGKHVLDIGGNAGFFTFESCKQNALSVDYYEGDTEYADFVSLAAEVANLSDVIKVHPEYFLFGDQSEIWDITFFLNVIHHIGFVFEKEVTEDEVKRKMLEHINEMAKYTKTMVFQMGYNWYGDAEKCLFTQGTKKEMEDYIRNGTADFWTIKKVGIPEKTDAHVVYVDMNETNNMRIDEYGEFLNRPLFIMESKLLSNK